MVKVILILSIPRFHFDAFCYSPISRWYSPSHNHNYLLCVFMQNPMISSSNDAEHDVTGDAEKNRVVLHPVKGDSLTLSLNAGGKKKLDAQVKCRKDTKSTHQYSKGQPGCTTNRTKVCRKPLKPIINEQERFQKSDIIQKNAVCKEARRFTLPTKERQAQSRTKKVSAKEKRCTLNCKDVRRTWERDFLLHSQQYDMAEGTVFINMATLHRSHSFSSCSGIGRSPRAVGNKWVVYGFV